MTAITPEIQTIINRHFPPHTHPYRTLEGAVGAHLTPSATVLEIGCGRTAPVLQTLKGKAERLIGIEVVEFTIADPDLILLPNDVADMRDVDEASVDVAFSRSVMEHVKDAEAAYSEISRVLRPGGRYIFLTPSLYDYGSLFAAIVPNALHSRIVNWVEGRDHSDTFPTFYRSNTRRTITRLATQNNLSVESFEYLGQYPNYFIFSPTLFRIGCHYAKFIEKHAFFHPLQGWIFCTLRKD